MSGIRLYGDSLLESTEAQLDDDSFIYIAELNGLDLSQYNVTQDQIEDPIGFEPNVSSGNPKDYALDFLYGKEKGTIIGNTIKDIYSFPSTVLELLFRRNLGDWKFVIDSITWIFNLGILISVILFIRGYFSKD